MDFTSKRPFAVLALSVFAMPFAMQASTVETQTYSGSFPATITGTLPNQGTALEETITLPSATTLTLFTNSYATGGFEPNVTLYNSTGNYVASSSTPGTSPMATTNSSTGLALDAYLTDSVAAGQYTIALTDWELNQSITATNLSDGFTSNYGDGIHFIDEAGNTLNGNYSLSIDTTSATTATPEPATLTFIAPLLIAAGLFGRKRILSSK